MQHFDPEDAGKILKIPLPRTPKPDQMIQAYDKQCMYSVKSGYQVAFHLKFTDQPSFSKARQTDWNGIWKLEIPEKLKIFMWRVAHDLLPTAGNLWKKKVLQDPWCQRCRKNRENIFHALIECKFSKRVWYPTNFKMDLDGLANQNMLMVMQELVGKRNTKDLEFFVTLCTQEIFSFFKEK